MMETVLMIIEGIGMVALVLFGAGVLVQRGLKKVRKR